MKDIGTRENKDVQMNKIIQGNAIEQLKTLPEKSVNMCMTSPPYWALRDYGTATWEGGNENCKHEEAKEKSRYDNPLPKNSIQNKDRKGTDAPRWKEECPNCHAIKKDLQLGLEPTFDEYIKNLCDIFDEVKRVLRDDGTCWVNIGDTYSGGGGWTGIPEDWDSISTKSKQQRFENPSKKTRLQDKSLVMIPFRFAIEMVNRGWILRNTIIWHKRNCMPSSVKDRFTVDFEYLFFFSKNKKYYFETQYEPVKEESIKRTKYKWDGHREKMSSWVGMDIKKMVTKIPYKENSKYESEEQERTHKQGIKGSDISYYEYGRNKRTVWTINPKPFKEAHFAVYPEELCETPIKAGCCEGGIVLDPFFGSGTTGLVALKQNKKFIGIELNPEYIEIAKKRLKPYLEQRKL